MTQVTATSPQSAQELFYTVSLDEIDGPALDWAVAQAIGLSVQILPAYYQNLTRAYGVTPNGFSSFRPSSDWATAGPLLREYQVSLTPEAHFGAEGTEMSERWEATVFYSAGEQHTVAPCRNELVALCRAIVVTKFGEIINVPKALGLVDVNPPS